MYKENRERERKKDLVRKYLILINMDEVLDSSIYISIGRTCNMNIHKYRRKSSEKKIEKEKKIPR